MTLVSTRIPTEINEEEEENKRKSSKKCEICQ